MFYAFSYTPEAADTAADPHVLDMQVTAGVIHQVDVVFQSGCDHKVFVQIFDGGHQLWPTNRGEKMRGDATVVSFREFYEMTPGKTVLRAKIWTTLDTTFYEIIIQIGVLDKAILQPLSFKELVGAMSGLGEKE
ncbi:MAG: hypothetical protein Q8N61_01710 [bacterium]|nr:hypothetical protein [bacterium]